METLLRGRECPRHQSEEYVVASLHRNTLEEGVFILAGHKIVLEGISQETDLAGIV